MSELRRILVVEDDERDVELIERSLRTGGLANRMDVVHDGLEALDYLLTEGEFVGRTTGEPAAILLDINMPRMGGIELLRHIRSTSALASLPVVFLTSSREEEDLLRAYRLGVNGYVVKPVSFSAFLEAIATVGAYWAVVNEPPGIEGEISRRNPK
ncbi:MAG: response regulator [Spirochaetota bacterium]